ncbi:MAG: DUF2996 domain-containing protein [Aphanocapsa feldmannii 277cV]|uniref:DUF2996 domain-containing protein n=2 Tax=Aphanocapsa feldmannii TaxID=192050 RepID=A0A524RL24_9CHRO|nr:MAG: DUF2996 domain-containing protein [Aphanocapsa feldmannii 277cV]TGH27867.1 MAG: DUF2996 domain-containing protein [Aphanocapsa feldmannii 277cI]
MDPASVKSAESADPAPPAGSAATRPADGKTAAGSPAGRSRKTGADRAADSTAAKPATRQTQPDAKAGSSRPARKATAKSAAQPTAKAAAQPDAKAAGGRPARKTTAKPVAKPRPPRPEDKPFGEFVPRLLMPAMARACQAHGGHAPAMELLEAPMPVVGGSCWQIRGELPGQKRFWLCFTTADINARKTIALAESGGQPSLLEPFLIDEKRMSLALLVSRLVQRLDGQKWLGPN